MKNLIILLMVCVLAHSTSAAIVLFDLEGAAGSELLPENSTGSPVSSGSGGEIGGGISLDTDTNVLTVNVGWGSGDGFSDLTGDATAAHFHGPADFNTSTGVALGLNDDREELMVLPGSSTREV